MRVDRAFFGRLAGRRINEPATPHGSPAGSERPRPRLAGPQPEEPAAGDATASLASPPVPRPVRQAAEARDADRFASLVAQVHSDLRGLGALAGTGENPDGSSAPASAVDVRV